VLPVTPQILKHTVAATNDAMLDDAEANASKTQVCFNSSLRRRNGFDPSSPRRAWYS